MTWLYQQQRLRALASFGYRLAVVRAEAKALERSRVEDHVTIRPIRGRWRDSRTPLRLPR